MRDEIQLRLTLQRAREAATSATDELLRNNERYAAAFDKGDLRPHPVKSVAVLTCMDARLNIYAILGLAEGDAHVIRNAGGVVTEDVIRSLTISQRLLGTREIVVVQHSDCGMLTFSEDEVKAEIEAEAGSRPPFALRAFADLEAEARQSVARLKANPFIPHKESVRAFVYNVKTGRLGEVSV